MIFQSADILIPKAGVDMEKWSVVACDQYTSQMEYWEEVESITKGVPSTCHMVFPEAYLESVNMEEKIDSINQNMKKYMESSVFELLEDTIIYVKREVAQGKIRHGLIGMIDLCAYDYHKGSTSPVRATEGTVESRIPPRVKIRKDAPLELPHIMLLFDDEENKVFSQIKEEGRVLYNFSLMQDGGRIEGMALSLNDKERVLSALNDFEKNTHLPYAVGDGNHSLATAKECFENLRKEIGDEKAMAHKARWALVELVNIHDSALEFEPIHRVLFDCEPKDVITSFLNYFQEASMEDNGGERIDYVTSGEKGSLYVKNGPSALAVGSLQSFLDDYTKKHGGKIDYIHGADTTISLGSKAGNMGFLLPAMEKSALFSSVLKDGALPRKTFSMGEANEKRFYLECREIK